jgi:predicted ABC-type ATPase
MSAIYIIAGPPGIGKSTRGHEFIDMGLDILNEDEMRFRYKATGYADYNEYSIQRVKDTIRQNLIRNQDFALELNLGFPHQYDYILSAKHFSHENTLNIILFFTDDVGLCLKRAKERHEQGLH